MIYLHYLLNDESIIDVLNDAYKYDKELRPLNKPPPPGRIWRSQATFWTPTCLNLAFWHSFIPPKTPRPYREGEKWWYWGWQRWRQWQWQWWTWWWVHNGASPSRPTTFEISLFPSHYCLTPHILIYSSSQLKLRCLPERRGSWSDHYPIYLSKDLWGASLNVGV